MTARDEERHRFKVCNIGGTLYGQPLNPTMDKKFVALADFCDMFVVAFSTDRRPRMFTQGARFYLLPRLRMPLLRYAMMVSAGTLLALWCVVRHDARTIMAQSPYEGFVGLLTKILARGFGKRVTLIVEAHGDFELAVFLQRRIRLPGLYRSVMRLTARIAIRNADLLRSVSNSSSEQLRRWVPDKTIMQFPAWTDIEPFLENAEVGANQRGQEIMFAGVLIPRKGVHNLINAFASIAEDLPEAQLVIAGRAENKEYAGKMRAMVKKSGLEERVRFVGELSQRELAAMMHHAAVFTLPAYAEGLPRVVWEAMAAGLPVVASDVSGIPELLKDGETGFLVQPGDEDGLADRLRWVLEHGPEAREMGKRARTFSKSFYSTEIYLNGFRSLLEAAYGIRREGDEPRASSAP